MIDFPLNTAMKWWDGDTVPDVGQIALDPVQPNLLYAGTNYLWRWNSISGTWKEHVGAKQLATATGATITAIAVAPTNDAVVYVATSDGALWLVTNALNPDDTKVVFTQLDKIAIGLPNRVITHIDVSPNSPTDILVTLSGFGGGHVFRCANTGNSLSGAGVRFTNQSGFAPYPVTQRLPDAPVNDITRDPNDPFNTFYVATDVGVFLTTNGGSTWQNATAPLGLPNVTANKIKAVPGTGYLNVATYGRGMWRIKLNDPGATAFTYTLAFSRSNGNVNVTVNLKNTGRIVNQAQIVAASLVVNGTRTVTTTNLPLQIGLMGSIPTNQSGTATFSFPANVGKPGTSAVLNLSGNYTGGSFTTSLRTRLP